MAVSVYREAIVVLIVTAWLGIAMYSHLHIMTIYASTVPLVTIRR